MVKKIPGSNLPPPPDEPCSECGTPVERSLMDSIYDTVPLCGNCMSNHLAEKTGKPTGVPTRDDPNWQDSIQAGNPMNMTWRLLKIADDDPLDQEFACPACDGVGGFDEGGVDGVMRGSPDDYITCFNCKGSGSIAPTFHPGKDGKGARGMTVFDTREEQHRKDYDVENAMPHGDMGVMSGDGKIHDPYRTGFPRDSPMKQTRVPIASDEQIANTDPALRHRLPSVYMREMGGQPTNAGLNITGASHPLFTMGNPMDMAWRMLKHDK